MSDTSHCQTPRQIVAELDRFIVGQNAAKRAVAIAVRNRWRRQQLDEEMRREVAPKNILMIGPTGVGKTEIARRLARLTSAPFIKVEASKYTEVGYYGRDVESMVRELVESAMLIVRDQEQAAVEDQAKERAESQLLEILAPFPTVSEANDDAVELKERHARTREKIRAMLLAGEMEERTVEITVEQKTSPMMLTNMGGDQMDFDLQGLFEKVMPRNTSQREMTVAEARKILFDEACEALISSEKVSARAIELAENVGIVFLDEIDKVVATDGGRGADVSRQGVQRDLLPIVEGTTVQTKYGYVKTDHILFVAAGAFHKVSPSDLMPELQGRFPIRVELTDLTKQDFVRILTEPRGSLTKQYAALMDAEGVKVTFTPDAIDALAGYAFEVNQKSQNIGARRLYTIMERLLEELSFESPDMKMGDVTINPAYVEERLDTLSRDEDLSQFIL
ncbi:MAG: HslU--HslV peptidase ATPase subunit [Planctomycetaceae bacterium]|nr:HslU--HslV peptidase ATPase subunit [Planctomycetaceae bacterium]